MKLWMLCLPVVLVACSHNDSPVATPPKTTVYSSGGMTPNVATTITNPNGTQTTTGNTVYMPAK
jgi:hypothetical protein